MGKNNNNNYQKHNSDGNHQNSAFKRSRGKYNARMEKEKKIKTIIQNMSNYSFPVTEKKETLQVR